MMKKTPVILLVVLTLFCRGDTRYIYPPSRIPEYKQNTQKYSLNLESLSALTYAATSFVKMTGPNTFSLDTTIYLTTETDPCFTVWRASFDSNETDPCFAAWVSDVNYTTFDDITVPADGNDLALMRAALEAISDRLKTSGVINP